MGFFQNFRVLPIPELPFNRIQPPIHTSISSTSTSTSSDFCSTPFSITSLQNTPLQFSFHTEYLLSEPSSTQTEYDSSYDNNFRNETACESDIFLVKQEEEMNKDGKSERKMEKEIETEVELEDDSDNLKSDFTDDNFGFINSQESFEPDSPGAVDLFDNSCINDKICKTCTKISRAAFLAKNQKSSQEKFLKVINLEIQKLIFLADSISTNFTQNESNTSDDPQIKPQKKKEERKILSSL